ncbi:MAG: hypothetical protein QOI01_3643 [Mycobacterium sp.]|jgi:hypothetical protein|nr:hypothetical protein [Mycobacterium sp.]
MNSHTDPRLHDLTRCGVSVRWKKFSSCASTGPSWGQYTWATDRRTVAVGACDALALWQLTQAAVERRVHGTAVVEID